MARRFTQRKKKGGYRGSLGAPMRGAFTTGAQQELKQMGGGSPRRSRSTQKFINKSLQKQKIAANAVKTATNAKHAKNAAIRLQIEQRKMVNDLVRMFEAHHGASLKHNAKAYVPK
jgi:hypothetical protein